MRFAVLTLLGIAAMLSILTSAPALPLFSSGLLRAVPLKVILPPSAVNLRTLRPDKMLWSLDNPCLWGAAADPSLRLADWSHVFDIAALGSFDVPLRSDAAERANILLAATAVDNVTLAPGQMFSFNDLVGERTPERGYQDGLMFDNGQVVRGTGGGICLVATGLYNAALAAGLEIDERHPHSGLVSYAPPGCDAGIAYGSEDLKFRNDTAFPLVIRAVPQGDTVCVRIFGKAPPASQRVVVKPCVLETFAAPRITKPDATLLPGQTVVDQKPRAGYSVIVKRYWTKKWRVIRREVVTQETRAPRPEIVRVGPPAPINAADKAAVGALLAAPSLPAAPSSPSVPPAGAIISAPTGTGAGAPEAGTPDE